MLLMQIFVYDLLTIFLLVLQWLPTVEVLAKHDLGMLTTQQMQMLFIAEFVGLQPA